jgi:hypothetical protein
MRRTGLIFAALLAIALALLWGRWNRDPEPEIKGRDMARVEPSPICPWRNPERDLQMLFPPATHFVLETCVVSWFTAQIQKRLGRLMQPDENPLRIHHVMLQGASIGSVLVTRVKGEHGAIEVVIGVETNNSIRAVLIQSQREPAEVAAAITSPAWLGSFAGRNAESPLRIGHDLPAVPEKARTSAEAIAAGVRAQLTVLSFAELDKAGGEPKAKPHH